MQKSCVKLVMIKSIWSESRLSQTFSDIAPWLFFFILNNSSRDLIWITETYSLETAFNGDSIYSHKKLTTFEYILHLRIPETLTENLYQGTTNYRCNNYMFFKVAFCVDAWTWQAFTPKMFDNWGISWGSRLLFGIYVSISCNNWMRTLVLRVTNYWKQQMENNKTQMMLFYWLKTVTSSSKSGMNYYPFKKNVESESFFFSVCCPTVMSLKPLFEWSQLQLSGKFTTVGI